MNALEISFNSRADLERQISAFKEQHPTATLDETKINRAVARAIETDNDGNTVGERLSMKIGYYEMP